MKCSKCNSHYDGKVCPNCGTRSLRSDQSKQDHPVEIQEDHRFCLFGFRSKKIWKMVISSIYLIYCLFLLIGILVDTRPAKMADRDNVLRIIENIIIFLLFINPYILFSNSALRDHLPILRLKKFASDLLSLSLATAMILFFMSAINVAHTPEYLADQEKHSYVMVEQDSPSCGESGLVEYECEVCGDHYEEEIPALGHDMQEHSIQEDGSVQYVCSRCGKMETRYS